MPSILDLPLEIRQQIYTLLLAQPSTGLHPAIISACRQTHHEALPILYTQNTFRCHTSLLTSFPRLHSSAGGASRKPPRLSETTCPGLRLIRRWYLAVRLDCGPFWDADRVSAAFTGAEELTLEVGQSQFLSSGNEVLRNFEAVRAVRTVRIWGSLTGLEDYVRWLEGVMKSPVGEEIAPYCCGGHGGEGEAVDAGLAWETSMVTGT